MNTSTRTRSQESTRAIERLYITMRHLFNRGFYKPGGVSGETLRESLLLLRPEIYGSIAEERTELLRNIRLKMMPTPDKIRADVSVHCTGPAGVEAVKAALRAGIDSAEKKSDRGDLKHNEVETDTINITLIAPPEYRDVGN